MMKTKDHLTHLQLLQLPMMKMTKYPQSVKINLLEKENPLTNAMKEHNTYMQESDKKMLAEMKEQAEKDRELRKEELGAFKDSMALLASARKSWVPSRIPWHFLQVPLQEEQNQ
ncbi:Hypothetical predicted protein [Paramuricea clavata]|uniref:Uncharacterized protein n=1 Tax=Paramuricea clavata TaxID=317549 RepID=A0A6S7I0D3_PARCT|nr:Hypothetical predicted protein [Paramuricea clavata]